MTKELFRKVFQNEIYPFIYQIKDNNSLIAINDPEKCVDEIYKNYIVLNGQYKSNIFPRDDKCLLDRHRVASCICGALLRTSVFDTSKLMDQINKQGIRMEAVFYYVNEMVALYAACKFLSFFLVHDNDDEDILRKILESFPIMPDVVHVKKGFWNCVLFNLCQIKDEKQIGLEHYDLYSYAMFFYNLETVFKKECLAC